MGTVAPRAATVEAANSPAVSRRRRRLARRVENDCNPSVIHQLSLHAFVARSRGTPCAM